MSTWQIKNYFAVYGVILYRTTGRFFWGTRQGITTNYTERNRSKHHSFINGHEVTTVLATQCTFPTHGETLPQGIIFLKNAAISPIVFRDGERLGLSGFTYPCCRDYRCFIHRRKVGQRIKQASGIQKKRHHHKNPRSLGLELCSSNRNPSTRKKEQTPCSGRLTPLVTARNGEGI